MNKSYQIICGEASSVIQDFPDEIFDTCITSPPYYSLRKYNAPPQIFPDGWEGQLGLEPYPSLYLEHLWSIFDTIKPKMKETACVFVVMGDSYAGSRCGSHDYRPDSASISASSAKYRGQSTAMASDGSQWLKPKNQMMMPARFAIGMVDRGWTQHNEITYIKKNAMPFSGKNRFTCRTERVYYFSKSGSPWFDLDAVRIPHIGERWGGTNPSPNATEGQYAKGGKFDRAWHPAGKNPGDVIEISTEPLYEPHFAAYPRALIRPLIRAGCPSRVCVDCGKPTCECGGETEPGSLVDPFVGSGTSLVVAIEEGRRGVGIDLSPEYCGLAKRRCDKAIRGFQSSLPMFI